MADQTSVETLENDTAEMVRHIDDVYSNCELTIEAARSADDIMSRPAASTAGYRRAAQR